MSFINMFSYGISGGGCVLAFIKKAWNSDVVSGQMVCLNVSA